MVAGSRAREGRGISVVPEMEFRPKTETLPEPEMDNPAETLREVGLGATRPYISDIASQYVTAVGQKPAPLYSLLVMRLSRKAKPHLLHRIPNHPCSR